MPNQVARLRRADIVACMTCPICDNLLLEATTISICLHTFCRNCIYEKLSDDDYDTCPVCDISLGCNPVDKLRPDHNLQDIRAKIFPMKRKHVSVSPPAKRKERSLSSLVVNTPKVSVHAGVPERNKRAFRRKSSSTRESSSSHEDLADDNVVESSSNKMLRNKKLVSSSAKYSNDLIMSEDIKKCSVDGKVELWKPLKCLVEAANRTKSNSKGISQVKAENGVREEVHDDKNSIPLPAKHRRVRPSSKSTAQVVVDRMRHQRQNMPIWFSLVASEEQNGTAPLPQVSSGFLRIKNGDMPVSSIQKYIANKLELSIEDEVQITLQGQVLHPNLQLRNLLDTWLKAPLSSRQIKTSVGSSGKEFVMVLTYSRKPQLQPQQIHKPNCTVNTKKYTSPFLEYAVDRLLRVSYPISCSNVTTLIESHHSHGWSNQETTTVQDSKMHAALKTRS
ncbi:uncharacterized protein [Phyllobates terribilis]|uniref:uncharacterized protein n=1 Tax=Phyllobates terribilis TaxID=111132 RepID=UPI003CCB7255